MITVTPLKSARSWLVRVQIHPGWAAAGVLKQGVPYVAYSINLDSGKISSTWTENHDPKANAARATVHAIFKAMRLATALVEIDVDFEEADDE